MRPMRGELHFWLVEIQFDQSLGHFGFFPCVLAMSSTAPLLFLGRFGPHLSGKLVNFDQPYCNCVLDCLLNLEAVVKLHAVHFLGVGRILDTHTRLLLADIRE